MGAMTLRMGKLGCDGRIKGGGAAEEEEEEDAADAAVVVVLAFSVVSSASMARPFVDNNTVAKARTDAKRRRGGCHPTTA